MDEAPPSPQNTDSSLVHYLLNYGHPGQPHHARTKADYLRCAPHLSPSTFRSQAAAVTSCLLRNVGRTVSSRLPRL